MKFSFFPGKLALACILLLTALFIGSCDNFSGTTLDIISGSENETLEPIIREFERQHHVQVNMHYKGSVDIMLELEDGDIPYDAVWPANSLWISLGDTQRIIKHSQSIMSSPVVFGIRKSLAEELGFVDRQVRVADILEAIDDGKFNFMMTSATQSNSGASAYMGFLYALSGNPDVLTMEHLESEQLKEDIRRILAAVHRSSGSSGWLKSLFLESNYDAMVNYEALIIETNQELERQGREPLYVVYPIDGIVIADSPLGYVNHGDSEKEEAFLELQNYLLSDEIQSQLSDNGRRTGIGALASDLNPEVFRSEWGIDTSLILSPFRTPSAEVISRALEMYQTELRKPSFTVFALDYSGSMEGSGESQLKEAMNMLLDSKQSSQYMIQTGENDVTVVLPFSSEVLDLWQIQGNSSGELASLNKRIQSFSPNGGTDIYSPVIVGLEILAGVENLSEYQPAIILLTDGESNRGLEYKDFAQAYQEYGLDVPVFSIGFASANENQLNQIAQLSSARVFNGRSDLVSAFRSAKGYN